jgi:simple sugar transport system permease protein
VSVAPHNTETTSAPMPVETDAARGTSSPAQRGGGQVGRLIRRPELGAFAGVVIVYAFFAITGKNGFLTLSGTASWMNTASELGILAIPVGLLMIAGEFDLSVGSVVGAASMIVGIGGGYYHWALWVAILLALSVGLLVGLGNGLLVVKTRLPSFIVTIAAQFIMAGVALGVSTGVAGTTAVTLNPHGLALSVFGSQWHRFHVSIVWWLAVAAVASWVLMQTPFGNWLFATGNNRDSARATGVPTDRVKVVLFMCTGMAAALVGAIQTITYSGGDVTYGQEFVFAAPVAAVIGGVLLSGGYGSAIGVLMGTMIYGIVQFGVFYTGWNTDWAQVVLGVLLLLAVLGNNYFRRLAVSARR